MSTRAKIKKTDIWEIDPNFDESRFEVTSRYETIGSETAKIIEIRPVELPTYRYKIAVDLRELQHMPPDILGAYFHRLVYEAMKKIDKEVLKKNRKRTERRTNESQVHIYRKRTSEKRKNDIRKNS